MDTQIAELPDTTYFLMARALEPTGEPTSSPSARSQPRHAVALGCDISHAAKFIPADGLLAKSSRRNPIGVSCRVCERLDCAWRAHPPVNHCIRVDPTVRRALPCLRALPRPARRGDFWRLSTIRALANVLHRTILGGYPQRLAALGTA